MIQNDQMYKISNSISKERSDSDIDLLLRASWGPLLETQNNLVNLINRD